MTNQEIKVGDAVEFRFEGDDSTSSGKVLEVKGNQLKVKCFLGEEWIAANSATVMRPLGNRPIEELRAMLKNS